MFHAISHQTKGRVAMATLGCGQQEHSADTGKEGHTEVYEQIRDIRQNNMAEGPKDP